MSEHPKVEIEVPGGLWHLEGIPVEIQTQKVQVHAPNVDAMRNLCAQKSGVKAGALQASLAASTPASIADLVSQATEQAVRKIMNEKAADSAKPDAAKADPAKK